MARVHAVPLSTVAGTALSGTYAAMNATGLPVACFRISITNTTANPVTISYDGANDHDVVAASSSIEISSQTNAQPQAWLSLFGQGLVVSIKGTSAMAGSVYLSGYYISH